MLVFVFVLSVYLCVCVLVDVCFEFVGWTGLQERTRGREECCGVFGVCFFGSGNFRN